MGWNTFSAQRRHRAFRRLRMASRRCSSMGLAVGTARAQVLHTARARGASGCSSSRDRRDDLAASTNASLRSADQVRIGGLIWRRARLLTRCERSRPACRALLYPDYTLSQLPDTCLAPPDGDAARAGDAPLVRVHSSPLHPRSMLVPTPVAD